MLDVTLRNLIIHEHEHNKPLFFVVNRAKGLLNLATVNTLTLNLNRYQSPLVHLENVRHFTGIVYYQIINRILNCTHVPTRTITEVPMHKLHSQRREAIYLHGVCFNYLQCVL